MYKHLAEFIKKMMPSVTQPEKILQEEKRVEKTSVTFNSFDLRGFPYDLSGLSFSYDIFKDEKEKICQAIETIRASNMSSLFMDPFINEDVKKAIETIRNSRSLYSGMPTSSLSFLGTTNSLLDYKGSIYSKKSVDKKEDK